MRECGDGDGLADAAGGASDEGGLGGEVEIHGEDSQKKREADAKGFSKGA